MELRRSACPSPARPPNAVLAAAAAAAAAAAGLTFATFAVPAASCAGAESSRRPVSDAPAFAAETDAWIADALARLEVVPALALAVVVDDEVVLARAWGTADREAGTPADARTQFYIASATKPFTALMAAMLDARGELRLYSPLADHLHGAALDPALKPAEVKLRDLLTHTSGIENGPIGFRTAFSGRHDPELLWGLLDRCEPAEDAPLGTYRYTNAGYNIYTMISDRETGKRWQDQLQDLLFAPLGMERTTAYMSLGARQGWPSAAPYFAFGKGGLERVALEKTDETMQSAGGLLTTAEDLARWLRFQMAEGRLDGRQVADPAVLRATHEPLVQAGGESESPFGQTAYGLGWSHGTWRGRRVLSHGGGFSGYRSIVSFLPDERIGVAAVVNEGSIGGMTMMAAATAAYDWWLRTAETSPQQDVEQLVQRKAMLAGRMKAEYDKRAGREWMLARPRPAYAGRYRNDDVGTIVIVERDGRLDVSLGNLRCTAEAFTQPETVRVELIPGTGRVLAFEPAEGEVRSVRWDDDVYVRVDD